MNILELNQELSSAFKDLKEGKIDAAKAQALVNIGKEITNNSKLLLQAAKMAKNPNIAGLVIGEGKAKELEYEDAYQKKTDFALKLGYRNLAEAVSKMGSSEFEKKFNELKK